jgi:hypothetical protein
MTFNDLRLAEPLLLALEIIEYKNPTPIQEQAIIPEETFEVEKGKKGLNAVNIALA